MIRICRRRARSSFAMRSRGCSPRRREWRWASPSAGRGGEAAGGAARSRRRAGGYSSLGDGSALDLVRWVRQSRLDARVVVITGFSNTFAAVEALSDGAMGYVLKAQSTADLLVAIRTVASGRSYVAPENERSCRPIGREPESIRVTGSQGLEALSRREREIFRHAVDGYATTEIARRLSISPKTVEFHRTK